jgi:hypothetical protein
VPLNDMESGKCLVQPVSSAMPRYKPPN